MAPGPYSALERSIERDALSVGKHYTVPGFCSADELSHAEQRRLALAAGHLSWHDLSAVLRAKHLDPQKHPSNFSCIVFLHDPVHAFLASYRRHTPFVVPGGAPVPLRNLSLPHLRALLDERLPPSDLLRLAESLLPALPDAPAPHPHARGLPTLRAAQRRLAARFRLPRTLGRTMTGVAEAHPWIPPASKRQPGRPDICRAALNLGHCVALDPRDPGFAAAWGKYVPWAPVPVVPAEPPEGSLDPARGKAVREALADEIALHGYARRRYQMLVAEGH
ncbi:hypothetical protein DFJ74DRAFT_648680 [Hyaloraphidium curvatum]|nr:hypothetical protein DFJ74DRAFT_648680 [Hyaloraphidium curvatum]